MNTAPAISETKVNLTSTESRALSLLGQGVSPSHTAAALGLTESAISQLLSRADFAEQVAELRFKHLAKHSERDAKADSLEDKLLKKLEDLIPYLMRPLEVARIYQIVNGAKRRGQTAPESITNQQEVVPLIMPIQIINQFRVNNANQVIQAGQQQLITVQSAGMQALLSRHKESQNVPILPAEAKTAGPSS
jgi:predicted transcriptional regulator